MITYVDDRGRLRDCRTGRFASHGPDETCPNGCERYGDWWVHDACRETVAAIRLGRRIGRTIPTHLLAQALRLATEEAALGMPEESQHLGAVWELAS